MPIQRYEQQVQEGALPGVKIQSNATPEAYGSGIGSAISRLGADANQWTGIFQKKEDEVNAADGALPRLGRKGAMRQESRKPLAGE